MIRKQRRNIRQVQTPADCYFCKAKAKPDYKQADILRRYVTDRGKILSRQYSGICARHQRQLAKQIGQARYLALLPYVALAKR